MNGMAPWDESSYFDNPQTTVTAVLTGASAQIIGADPMRISLVFSVSITSGQAAILPGKAPVNSTSGIQLGNTLPLVFTYKDMGAMVQAAWFGFNQTPGSLNFVVLSQSLLKWPQDRPNPGAEQWAQLARAVMGVSAQGRPKYPTWLKEKPPEEDNE